MRYVLIEIILLSSTTSYPTFDILSIDLKLVFGLIVI